MLFSTFKTGTRSTVSISEDSIWLSLTFEHNYRFDNHENQEGTYRINLKDKSCLKVSDNNYEKLFALEDGLFGLDRNCKLYKMDFDGNIIKEIVIE